MKNPILWGPRSGPRVESRPDERSSSRASTQVRTRSVGRWGRRPKPVPEAEAPPIKHTHPDEEIIYILEGSLEYEVEGKPPTTVKAGDPLGIPRRSDPRGEERRQRQRG